MISRPPTKSANAPRRCAALRRRPNARSGESSAPRLAGFKFKRQLPIDSYIVDFVCLSGRLIVEADGSQHGGGADAVRDRYLRRQGFRIERYWNNDILNEREKVTTAILNALEECEASRDSPLPPTASRRAPPSPARGEGY